MFSKLKSLFDKDEDVNINKNASVLVPSGDPGKLSFHIDEKKKFSDDFSALNIVVDDVTQKTI